MQMPKLISTKDKVFFARLRPDAKIPTKREEDGCYDLYACFDEECIVIRPGEVKIIPTGILSACSSKYRLALRERGSTGTLGMCQMAGQIDSGYRGEIMVPILNTGKKALTISKSIDVVDKYNYIYPYSKAITQIAIEFVPDVEIEELSVNDLRSIESDRGDGKLGSSGK